MWRCRAESAFAFAAPPGKASGGTKKGNAGRPGNAAAVSAAADAAAAASAFEDEGGGGADEDEAEAEEEAEAEGAEEEDRAGPLAAAVASLCACSTRREIEM